MDAPSSYLRHLPPVLWQDDPATTEFSLGAVLRIVEKVLTGIDDGVALPPPPANGRPRRARYPAITEEIARSDRLYDPWTTPPDFLPWLASWVALEFPTLQGTPVWDEYQRRKVTADIAQIYRLRGRKAGLNRYLDLYAVGPTRPRVALDDGTRVLELRPTPGALAAPAGIVTRGPVVAGVTVRAEGITRPWSVAAGSDGGVFVGDTATPPGAPVQMPSRVWHLDAAGHPDCAGTPPVPRPVAPDTLPIAPVVGLAVRRATAAAGETLYVLDTVGRLYAVTTPAGAPWSSATASLVAALAGPGSPVTPVAMAIDPADGDLLILDRGSTAGSPAVPAVITVRPAGPTVVRHPLPGVVEPLCLVVEAGGTLLVGDGGDQAPADPPGPGGNVVRIDRSAATWTAAPLLPAGTALLAPTAVARTRDGRLYVLDAGLRPFSPDPNDPFVCAAAEPAAVYEVVPGNPAAVRRISEPGQFVYPTGMAAVDDRLVICDPGQPEVAGVRSFRSRVQPFMFDVVIHFAAPRLPDDPAQRQRVLEQAFGTIRTIIESQKPAHTVWNLITAI